MGDDPGPRVVVFVCVENACRSLMAEALFNTDPPEGWRAISAGTRPARSANPRTASMLKEIGVQPPDHAPQLLSPETMATARIRVTMGCLDDASCPARLKRLDYRDWKLPDPAPLDDAGFRRVRDQLRAEVEGLRQEIRRADLRRAARSPSP
jgi:arsenate reductase